MCVEMIACGWTSRQHDTLSRVGLGMLGSMKERKVAKYHIIGKLNVAVFSVVSAISLDCHRHAVPQLSQPRS
jgi:hypothetical protein